MGDSQHRDITSKPLSEMQNPIEENSKVRVYERPKRPSLRILLALLLIIVTLATFSWIVYQAIR